MKASEGSWVDFDGNAFGSGQGTSNWVAANGRYDWGPPHELNNVGDEDYAIISVNGRWNDTGHNHRVLCHKPK